MFICVCGSRYFCDYDVVRICLGSLLLREDLSKVTIINGGATGADALATQFCIRNSINYATYPANWNLYGKRAGYIRNSEMAKLVSDNHGIVVAFWDGKSRGTKMMIDLAKQLGVTTYVYKI